MQTATTDEQGRFDFPDVALGTYRLSVARTGFITSTQPVTIESGYFPAPRVLLLRSVKLAAVTVSAPAEPPPVVASITPIDARQIKRTFSALRGRTAPTASP